MEGAIRKVPGQLHMELMRPLPEWEEGRHQTEPGWLRVWVLPRVVLVPQKEPAQRHQTDSPPQPVEQQEPVLVEERSSWLPFPRDRQLAAEVARVPEQRQERLSQSSMEEEPRKLEPVEVVVLHTCRWETAK